jgi:nucleotide-binding universal stress UspA family protein
MNPDLIVMATHGRSGFQHLMLGSVTEKVLHKSGWPVLTVPPRSPDAVPAGPAPFKRILCGMDFSACSEAALRYAVALAGQAHAHLDMLNVVQLVPMYDATAVVPLDYAGMLEHLKADVRQRLDKAVAGAAAGLDVDRLVTTGNPYREIVRVAAERSADLVVLGAYSHGGLDHALFGSTTNHVVRRAGCPVLTVRN